jgi:hypothetical protein
MSAPASTRSSTSEIAITISDDGAAAFSTTSTDSNFTPLLRGGPVSRSWQRYHANVFGTIPRFAQNCVTDWLLFSNAATCAAHCSRGLRMPRDTRAAASLREGASEARMLPWRVLQRGGRLPVLREDPFR